MKKNLLPLLVVLFVISVYKGNRYAIFAIVLMASIILVLELWKKYSFTRLTVNRKFSRNTIFYGEKTHYILEVENRKPLPILWLQIDDLVTKGIEFSDPSMVTKKTGSHFNVFTDIFNLKWYEKVTRKYPIKPTRRGFFTFGNGELKSNDLFAINHFIEKDKGRVELVVYPKVLPMERLGLSPKKPFGRKMVKQWIYKDPSNKVGVRDYRRGDRLNQINWQATAKQQELQSYEIKPAMDENLYIFLGARLNNYHWEGMNLDTFELAVVAAASIVDFSINKGYNVGFMSNGIIYERSPYIKVEPGKGLAQRKRLLTSLAMVEPFFPEKLSSLVKKELAEMVPGSKTVIITSLISESLIRSIRLLKKRNFQPTIIKIGSLEDKWRRALGGVQVYTLSEERLWNEIEKIELD